MVRGRKTFTTPSFFVTLKAYAVDIIPIFASRVAGPFLRQPVGPDLGASFGQNHAIHATAFCKRIRAGFWEVQVRLFREAVNDLENSRRREGRDSLDRFDRLVQKFSFHFSLPRCLWF